MAQPVEPSAPARDASSAPHATAPSAGGPHRRRWGRRLGMAASVLLLLFGAGVAFAPRILSTPTGTDWVVALANRYLDGQVHVDRLDLSWGGPLEVHAFRLEDEQQREIVRLARADTPVGLWRLARKYEHFTQIVIESPEVVIYEKPETGEVEVEKDFSLGPLTDVLGKVEVENGTFRFVRLDGSSYRVDGITGQVDLKTLNEVTGTLTMRPQDGSRIACEASITNLFPQKTFEPLRASGTIQVRTEEGRIKLNPLARLAGHDLQGTAAVTLDGTFEPGKTQTTLTVDVADVQSAARAARQAAPINARLTATLVGTPEEWSGDTTVTGDPGSAQATFHYRPSDEPIDISRDRLISGLLAGESVMWPNVTIEGKSTIDLAKLGQAVPELLHVREEQTLTAGTLEVSKLTARGGHHPALSASLSVKDVAADGGGKVTRLPPITAEIDAAIEPDQGLHVRQLAMNASFARLNGSGTVSNLNVTVQSDLAKLQQEVGEIFDLGAADLAGQVDATLDASRRDEQHVDLKLEATIEQLRYTVEQEGTVQIPRMRIEHTATITLDGQQATRWNIERFTVDAGSQFTADTVGFYDLRDRSFRAEVNVPRGELPFIAERIRPLGGPDLSRYAGTLTSQAVFTRTGAGQPLTSQGRLTASALTVDQQPLAGGGATIEWSDLTVAPDGGSVQVASARLESGPARFDVRNVRWQDGDTPSLEGEVEGSADLAASLAARARINRQEKAPAIDGRLNLNARAKTQGDTVALTGQGRIDDFKVPGTTDLREQAEWTCDLTLHPKSKTLTITRCDLNSRPLSFQLAGRVDEYDTRRVLNVTGSYEAVWSELSTLLHELAPHTRTALVVTGKSAGPIRIQGPANVPDVRPAFRDVRAGCELGWSGANLYGVQMAGATLRPSLVSGQLTVPRTTIAAGDGQVQFVANVDFAPDEPLLTLPGTTPVLEKVPVTREMGDKLLSRINPIFMHTYRLVGRVDLTLQDIAVPVGEGIKQRGTGRGRLDLSNLQLGPNPLLMELLALTGVAARREDGYRVQTSAVDFELKGGRLHYDHFTLTFPENLDLRFRGSVGFDDTLDLIVSLPVRAELLERLGVRATPAQVAELVTGARVDIPLGGTRENPRLDLARLELGAQAKGILERAAGTALERLLEPLQRPRERRQRK